MSDLAYPSDRAGNGGAVEAAQHVKKIATSTYYSAKNRTPSTRTVRDTELKIQISRVHWTPSAATASGRPGGNCTEGLPVARCTAARLVHDLGLEGARRGKKLRTPVRENQAHR